MILVPTVPHTGSHFVTRHLLKTWRQWPLKGHPSGVPPLYRFDHVYSSKMPYWVELLGRNPAIVPLRHPRAVCETHKKRRESLEVAVECFHNMVTMVDKFEDVHYLPLDVPDRQNYLDKINERLAESFETDWPKVHSQTPAGLWAWHGTDEAILQTIWKAHEEFFLRFWPDAGDTGEK